MRSILIAMAIAGMAQSLLAQDVQWRGPNRDGIYPDTGLVKEWPGDGPEVLFVAEDLGRGFSSAVATKDRIFVSGIEDSTEFLISLDMEGKLVWRKPIGRCFNQSFPETRGTPTVEDDRVYVLTGIDKLVCFLTGNGDVLWSVDLHEVYGSRWDMFGVSESVLLCDDMLLTTPCGDQTTVIALDKMSGELIWKSETLHASRGNMSPILIEHCGEEYFITSTQTKVLGVDPDNGEILWDFHYNFLSSAHENTTILANTPIYRDSCLWISNGWEVPSIMLEIAPDGKSVSEKFRDRTFDNQNHGVVLVDGFLYGSNFTGRNSGKWVCMNWNTGEIVWIEDFHNKGPIICADGMLYLYEEKRGHLGLAKADPEKFELASTFRHRQGAGAHWARPTIFNQVLFVRHGETLTAYDIKKR